MAFANSSEVNSVTPIVHRNFAVGPRECRRIQQQFPFMPFVDTSEATFFTQIPFRIWTSTDLIGYLDFPHHQQVFQIEQIREHLTTGKIEHEVVCGITSRAANKASPEQLLEFARQHWAIENRLHWVRDVTFTEDHSQVRKGNAPQLLASIRNLAIGMCRLAGITVIADAIRLFTDRLDLACRLIGL